MISIDPELEAEYGLSTVLVSVEGIQVRAADEAFRERKRALLEEARRAYDLASLKEHPYVRAYRDFYWRIGIDPTKQRPSAEALLRRVLQGKELPAINNCVDAYNLASLLTLIPMGAYDRARISGPLRVRRSEGELFQGIGGRNLLTRGEVVLADREQILSIYPYRDGEGTKVVPGTREVLLVLCGVRGIPRDSLRAAAERALQLVLEACGGRGEVLGGKGGER
jgi:DNA/RNA-binding domain of Phe-tRNA-synthetase-like protein